MNKAKEIFLQILGGIGWLMYGVALALGGALEQEWASILCVAVLTMGAGMVYFGIDKIMGRPRRW
jgi:hypothetical protein